MQRRIRRNLLKCQIGKDHEKAVCFDRQAKRHQKRAATKIKAANRKLQLAHTIQTDNGKEAASQDKGNAGRKNKAWERHQTQNRKKKARLEMEAKLLKKEAAVITKDANRLATKASKHKADEDAARLELAQLTHADDGDDHTLVMEDPLQDFDQTRGTRERLRANRTLCS